MSKEIIDLGWQLYDRPASSLAVKKGDLLFISGQAGVDPATGKVVGQGDIVAQTHKAYENAAAVLEAAGASFDDVVKTNEFITTLENYKGTADIRREYLTGGLPASTGIIVREHSRPGVLIEIEFIVSLDKSSPKEVINPGWDFFSRYTFSPGVRKGNLLFTSGFTAGEYDSTTDTMFARDDMVYQTNFIYDKLNAILEAAGASFAEDVVQTVDYITTRKDYRATGDTRRKHFRELIPASTAIVIQKLLLEPAYNEIDLMAVYGSKKELIYPNWPGRDFSKFSFAPGVKKGNMVVISGQTASQIDPSTGEVVIKGDVEEQTRAIYQKIKDILEAAGGSLRDLVRVTQYLTRAEDSLAAAKARQEFFGDDFPTVNEVVVNGIFGPNPIIEVDGYAILD